MFAGRFNSLLLENNFLPLSSHGEICSISPLQPTYLSDLLQNYKQWPAFRTLFGSAMVAMASFTKVIVVVLKPKFRVIFWQHLNVRFLNLNECFQPYILQNSFFSSTKVCPMYHYGSPIEGSYFVRAYP